MHREGIQYYFSLFQGFISFIGLRPDLDLGVKEMQSKKSEFDRSRKCLHF
jgi:hypothetical protein